MSSCSCSPQHTVFGGNTVRTMAGVLIAGPHLLPRQRRVCVCYARGLCGAPAPGQQPSLGLLQPSQLLEHHRHLHWYVPPLFAVALHSHLPAAHPFQGGSLRHLVAWGTSHAGNFLEKSQLSPALPPLPSNLLRPYRPRINMWPAAADGLLTTVTVNCAKSHLLFQGDPQIWERGLPPRHLLTAPRVPFVRVRPPAPAAMHLCVCCTQLHARIGTPCASPARQLPPPSAADLACQSLVNGM